MDFAQLLARNTDVDAAEDVISQGGDYPWPSAAVTPTIVSSSGNDHHTDGGGAHDIWIEGLDANYNLVTELVEIIGTTAKSLVNSYLRINRAWVSRSGNAGTNSGTIDIASGFDILAQIPAGHGESQQCIYTVPAHIHGARITRWYFRHLVTSNQATLAALQVRKMGRKPWLTKALADLRLTSSVWDEVFDPNMGVIVKAEDDVRLRVLSVGSSNTPVIGGFSIALQRGIQ